MLMRELTYKTDLEQFGVPEFWQEAGAFGDCEDYALLKRHRLIESGFARKEELDDIGRSK